MAVSDDVPDEAARQPGYVLVVGDDAGERGVLERALERAGFDAMGASEAEVLAAADLNPPRLVVVDTAEAAGDRFSSLQHLLAHRPLADAPLVALVLDRDVEAFRRAVVRGAATCLAKPVDAASLAAAALRLAEWSPPPPEVDSRRHRRRPLLLDVLVSERESGRLAEGRMVEASSAGCRLDVPYLIEPGTKVRIVLRAHEQETQIALGGEVRWAQKRDDGRGAAGVRFNASTVLVAARALGFGDEADSEAD